MEVNIQVQGRAEVLNQGVTASVVQRVAGADAEPQGDGHREHRGVHVGTQKGVQDLCLCFSQKFPRRVSEALQELPSHVKITRARAGKSGRLEPIPEPGSQGWREETHGISPRVHPFFHRVTGNS